MVLALALLFARFIPRGEPPDELAHISYLQETSQPGTWLPDYSGSRILGRGRLNYLEHPPLYYTTLGMIAKAFDWDPYDDYIWLRQVSALMVALGAFFWVLTAFALRIDLSSVIVASLALCCIPMFGYMAGAINNDSMAYLGVAVAIYGFTMVKRRATFCYVAAIGVAMVLLTKATAGLFMAVFSGAWLLNTFRNEHTAGRHILIAAGLVCVVCAAYYLPTLAHYGTFFPHPRDLYAPDDQSRTMGFVEFSKRFTLTFFPRLPVIGSHNSVYPLKGGVNIAFWCMLASVFARWVLQLAGARAEKKNGIVLAFLIALSVTFGFHVMAMWQEYLTTGKFAGVQPRYYSFALPGVLLLASLGPSQPILRRAHAIANIVLAVIVALLFPVVPALSMLARAAIAPTLDYPL